MDEIFFLLLAFLTSISSIKLSYYGDALSKQSKLGSVLIGGLLIASITSLPELITCISSVLINNPSLSFGDILGSNMFNIFILSIFNIYFFKKNIFKNIKKEYLFETFILILEYIFIIIGCTLVILFIKNNKNKEIRTSKVKYVSLKFIVCSFLLIILSVLLTLQVDKISHLYPNFSSSSLGAILLGITTSLPEVVTTFELFRINNVNMAISNMLGSNIFNFLVLSLADIFIKNGHVYSYSDKYSMMYVYGGLIITFFLSIIILNKYKNKLFYLLLSLIMSLIYLLVWYFQFV